MDKLVKHNSNRKTDGYNTQQQTNGIGEIESLVQQMIYQYVNIKIGH